jgi:hypothetical protein
MPVVGSRRFYRRTNLPLIESWNFVAAAVLLVVVGGVVDIL